MSLEAIVWAWRRPVQDQMELLLLLALSDYANQDGECWPSYDRLLEKTRIRSRATLSKKLASLEESGLIERNKRPISTGGSKTTVYRINLAPESSSGELSREFISRAPKVHQVNSPSTVNQSDITSQLYIYTDDFNLWWSNYPKRQGDQGNKKKTFQRYTKLLSEGFTEQQLLDAAIRYREFCSATGKLNTEYVKQTTTFLNDSGNVENRWTVNHEDRQRTHAASYQSGKAEAAAAIWNAPGCESLDPEQYQALFGDGPFQSDEHEEAAPDHLCLPVIGED